MEHCENSIVEKPYTDENDLICWHYDHSKGRNVKGINFITSLYEVDGVTLPVAFRLVTKTETYIDKKGKEKRRSEISKNEHFRAMLTQLIQNQIPFRYVLSDIWFASAENMLNRFIVRFTERHGPRRRSGRVKMQAMNRPAFAIEIIVDRTIEQFRGLRITHLNRTGFAKQMAPQLLVNGTIYRRVLGRFVRHNRRPLSRFQGRLKQGPHPLLVHRRE